MFQKKTLTRLLMNLAADHRKVNIPCRKEMLLIRYVPRGAENIGMDIYTIVSSWLKIMLVYLSLAITCSLTSLSEQIISLDKYLRLFSR